MDSIKDINHGKGVTKKVKKKKIQFSLIDVMLFFIFVIVTFFTLYPFYLMIISATYDSSTITSELHWLPGEYLLENYNSLMANIDIWTGFKNSLIIAVSATFLSIYFGALTAYGFARFKFKGKSFLFWLVIGSMMIPPQLGIVGFFKLCMFLNLTDNLLAFIIPSIASAYCVFFVRLYIEQSVPASVIESARIDGAGEFKIFNKIIVPMIVPSLATMAIFHFISNWNNFMMPLVILTKQENQTLPILIALSKGVYGSDIGAQFVAIAMGVVPIIIVFMFASRYIISGLTAGAEKG